MSDVSLRLLLLKSARLDDARAFYEGAGPAHYAGKIGDVVVDF